MEQSNQSKKVLLSVIGVAILVVAVVGVSFAFFSYTRTGDANTIRTGTIVFNSTESSLGITNAFPIETSIATNATQTIAGQVVVSDISVSGSTTYANGIDYEVRVGSVYNSNSSIKPRVSVTAKPTTNVTAVADYTTGSVPATLAADTLLAHGKISGATDGSITLNSTNVVTIKAWYDKADYHISDNTKQELYDAGLLTDPYNGTVVTTSAWNTMNEDANSAYSFTIVVNAVEGASAS